jgi:hypothetical protein
MAKQASTKAAATIVVEDNASVGHNSAARLLDVAFDCGKSMAGSDGALTSLIKPHLNNEPLLATIQRAFYEGYVASRLNIDRLAAKVILDKGKFSALPTAKVDLNRSHPQERIYGAARVAFSRAKAFAEGPKARTKPGKPEKPATKPASAPESAPVKHVVDLVIERAATPAQVNEHMALLVQHMLRYQKANAVHFKGDEGAIWRNWLIEAPTV